MANNVLTMQNIAREALPLLVEKLVMPMTVNRDYSNDFVGKGKTIQVERPAVFVADEFGGTINLQDINETSVPVTMNKIADVSFKVSSADLALEITQFKTKYLDAAAIAIAEKINRDGLSLYEDIPYYYGVSGTTPDSLDDFAQAEKILNDNKVPMDERFAVWDTAAKAKFQVLDAIVNADKSGTTEALRKGAIGDVAGFNNLMSQAVRTHTAGTFTAVATPLTNGTIAADATVLTLDGGAGTETLLKGDVLKIGTEQFVVTANAAAVAGAISVNVYPAVEEEITDGTAVVFPDKTAGAHVANLAYHPKAFIFVTRPLDTPPGVESYVTSYEGITLRVTMAYDINTKETTMSIDTLYDYVTAYPELATRVLG